MRPRTPDEVVRWATASELVATVPRGADLDQVRAAMDAAARAEGRTVATTYLVGRRLVGWCPLGRGADPRWARGVAA